MGLGFGRIVFVTLNKVEIVFSLIIFYITFAEVKNQFIKTLVITLTGILALQSSWLRPLLDQRAELIISGQAPPVSLLHITYIVLEFIKIIILFTVGFKNLQLSFFDQNAFLNRKRA